MELRRHRFQKHSTPLRRGDVVTEPAKTLRDHDHGSLKEGTGSARGIEDCPQLDRASCGVACALQNEIYQVVRCIDLAVRASLLNSEALKVIRRRLPDRPTRRFGNDPSLAAPRHNSMPSSPLSFEGFSSLSPASSPFDGGLSLMIRSGEDRSQCDETGSLARHNFLPRSRSNWNEGAHGRPTLDRRLAASLASGPPRTINEWFSVSASLLRPWTATHHVAQGYPQGHSRRRSSRPVLCPSFLRRIGNGLLRVQRSEPRLRCAGRPGRFEKKYFCAVLRSA